MRSLLLSGILAAAVSGYSLSGAVQQNSSRFNPRAVSPRIIRIGTKPLHVLAANGKVCWKSYRLTEKSLKSRRIGIYPCKKNFSVLYCSEIFTGQQ